MALTCLSPVQITLQGSKSKSRLFSTSNSDRFYITPWPEFGPTAEQYAYARGTESTCTA